MQKLVPKDKVSKEGSKPLFPPLNVIHAKQLKPLVPQKATVHPPKANSNRFEVLNKFFTKSLNQYTPSELKNIHYDIINDMILYEEKFLVDHKEKN